MGAASPELDASGLYLAGAGLGIVAGLLLERRGFRIDPMVLALTIALGGGLLALTTKSEGVIADARTYAVVLGVVAVAKIARAVAADRPPARTRRTAALLVAWAGAALIAGVPSDAASSASADEGERSELSSATHTGPECMAGRAVPDP